MRWWRSVSLDEMRRMHAEQEELAESYGLVAERERALGFHEAYLDSLALQHHHTRRAAKLATQIKQREVAAWRQRLEAAQRRRPPSHS